jgi:hypothetical protein
MKHYDIKFYSNDENKRVALISFRSEKLARKFIEKFEHLGGFTRFTWDDYGWNDFFGKIEILPCNKKGFETLMVYLYN